METIVAVAGMLVINLLGWAFTFGMMWQKLNGVIKSLDEHKGMPGSKAHPANGGR